VEKGSPPGSLGRNLRRAFDLGDNSDINLAIT